VRCEYGPDIYNEVHNATAIEKAVVIVYGEAHWDRITNGIHRVKALSVETTRSLTESEFNRFFGSAPEFTGTMTTEEYIDWVRGDGE